MRFVLTLAFLATACGDGGGSALALESYCTEWTSAVCEAASRCACATAATCSATAEPRCPLAPGLSLRMDVESGAVAYDPESAARQIEHLRAAGCDEDPLSCGTSGLCFARSAAGGPCDVNTGCTAELACVDGACVEPTGGGIGERCTDDSECASGRCDFATESCREPLPAGGLCVKHSDCNTGYCDRPRDLAAGTCAERQAAGAACREGPMCVDGACVGGVCVVAICAATM